MKEFEKWWNDWGKCPGDEKNNYRKFLGRESWKAALEWILSQEKSMKTWDVTELFSSVEKELKDESF